MRLTEKQLHHIRFHVDGLLERAGELRAEGMSAPADAEMELLFTDPDDYEIESDEVIEYHLSVLRGIAIGLDLFDAADLYQVWKEGLEEHRCPDVSLLVVASERALTTLKDGDSELVREIVNELGEALSPFKGREWR